jgi:predicted negative regulator of RcsB-dependent stress response
MEDNNELIKILLAELVIELGGTAKLNATKILTDIKENKFKEIGLRIDGDVAIIEVFEQNDN